MPYSDDMPERGSTADGGRALAHEMIEAHGGLALWSRIDGVKVHLSFAGLGFRLKFLKMPIRGTIVVRRGDQQTILEPFPCVGQRGVFEGSKVRIKSLDGHVLSHRSQPRKAFRDFRHSLWWDNLDLLYFAGQAMWTYISVPFVLTNPEYELHEAGTWEENGEIWRKLRVRFPPSIHTHCREQVFYADRRGLICRHDYTSEPFGSWARAANYSSDHRDFGGLVIPGRRRVHLRRANGRPLPHPILIWIDVQDVTMLTASKQ